MTPEAKVKAAVERFFRKLKAAGQLIRWYKVHGSGRTKTGEPDLDVIFHGYSVKIELKAPGQRPTKIQEVRLAECRAAGGLAFCASSVVEVASYLQLFCVANGIDFKGGEFLGERGS